MLEVLDGLHHAVLEDLDLVTPEVLDRLPVLEGVHIHADVVRPRPECGLWDLVALRRERRNRQDNVQNDRRSSPHEASTKKAGLAPRSLYQCRLEGRLPVRSRRVPPGRAKTTAARFGR